MTLEIESIELLQTALKKLDQGFETLPTFTATADIEKMKGVLMEVAEKMHDNYPYPHPLYAGQMLKPPHPIARMAYALSMWINPNNHALDGGRASSAMEKEVVRDIAAMFGWDTHLGHLSSGGTMANMEALWVAGSLHPGKKIVASTQAHYTHNRISHVLGHSFEAVPSDAMARMDLNALESMLQKKEIGTVVVTLGTTGFGSIDPLPQILELKKQYDFRIHVDAAYGGYFTLASNLSPHARSAFDAIHQVDSIVVDPHKHGLQPYGCGCILFKDPSVGRIYKHDSPYTYFSSDELHLGEISLECSRAGASAVGLWATMKMLPLEKKGEFSKGLDASQKAAQLIYDRLGKDSRYITLFPPELDIIVWAPKGEKTSEISQKSQAIFDQAARENLHLALITLPEDLTSIYFNGITIDNSQVTLLRSCLMKPEHIDWVDKIWNILDKLADIQL